MYEISKTFEFCYGHRVWTQRLHPSLSEGAPCACRHLHGHQAKVQVSLAAPTLENNMVTDFKNLAFLKTWLDRHVDHRTLIDENDPLLPLLSMGCGLQPIFLGGRAVAHAVSLKGTESPHERELLEGLTVVPFCPTSENLARWLHQSLTGFFQQELPQIKVSRVTWWETPKSCASYTA